jgi:hypothetical protein
MNPASVKRIEHMRNLKRRFGSVMLSAIGADEVTDWYDQIRWPGIPTGGRRSLGRAQQHVAT